MHGSKWTGTAYGKARVSHCACAMLICHKQAPLPQPNPPPPSDSPPYKRHYFRQDAPACLRREFSREAGDFACAF
ncbi:hypothetical protein CE91St64_23770 [Faecalicatena contorta]|nr:hypothetical protein CE91St64_23770 [Faecalicatena contorta]